MLLQKKRQQKLLQSEPMTRKTNIRHKNKSAAILELAASPCHNLCNQRNSMQMVLDQPCS